MSTAEIIEELPRLTETERRAITRRILELEAERSELELATENAEAGFREMDRMEAEDAKAKAR